MRGLSWREGRQGQLLDEGRRQPLHRVAPVRKRAVQPLRGARARDGCSVGGDCFGLRGRAGGDAPLERRRRSDDAVLLKAEIEREPLNHVARGNSWAAFRLPCCRPPDGAGAGAELHRFAEQVGHGIARPGLRRADAGELLCGRHGWRRDSPLVQRGLEHPSLRLGGTAKLSPRGGGITGPFLDLPTSICAVHPFMVQ